MSTLAHLELWTGLSGDMWVGAFLDAGWPEERLEEGARALALPGVTVEVESRSHGGLTGRGIRVRPREGAAHRHLSDILRILEGSELPREVIERAGSVFRRLASAEARVHGTSLEAVHFHEVGAHDAIVDIAMACLAVHDLGVRVTAGSVPLSRGEVTMAHGTWPVPAPATALLLEGWPVHPDNAAGEFITPTGAVLLRELATPSDVIPAMCLQRMGFGAGTRAHPLRPNMVRLWLGEPVESVSANRGSRLEDVVVLETHVDDLDPRWFADLVDDLREAGALDVFSDAVSMKKGRWGTRLTVICRPEREPVLVERIFRQSSTLGIRRRAESRWELDRESETLESPWGPVRIKWIEWAGERRGRFEADDILRLARDQNCPPAEMERRLDRWRETPGGRGSMKAPNRPEQNG